MADRKITELSAMSAGGQANGDLLTIVDVSEAAAADKNKKITMADLFRGIPASVGINVAVPGAQFHVKSTATAGGNLAYFDDSGSGITGRFQILTTGGASTDGVRLAPVNRKSIELGSAVGATTPVLYVDVNNDVVGVGTTAPQNDLHVQGSSDGVVRIQSGGTNGQKSGIRFQNSSDNNNIAGGIYSIRNGGTDHDLVFNTYADAERLRIDSAGNALLGGTTSPASAAKSLAIFNGTAPTGSVANGVVLYAEDVSSSSELKVRDEAGNVTTLSPHNFDLIPEGPSEDMAWSYYSEKDGKRINVDMLKAVRLLEQLTGEQLVFTG